jgi:hypothetical protein
MPVWDSVDDWLFSRALQGRLRRDGAIFELSDVSMSSVTAVIRGLEHGSRGITIVNTSYQATASECN